MTTTTTHSGMDFSVQGTTEIKFHLRKAPKTNPDEVWEWFTTHLDAEGNTVETVHGTTTFSEVAEVHNTQSPKQRLG